MDELFIAYKTDDTHSVESREVVGICDTIDQCLNISQLHASNNDNILTIDDIVDVGNNFKTIGFNGKGEFFYHLVSINDLI